MSFEKIDICDIKDSFTRLVRDDWALLTAGKAGDYNTMTVSWGMTGELWGKDLFAVFVRLYHPRLPYSRYYYARTVSVR